MKTKYFIATAIPVIALAFGAHYWYRTQPVFATQGAISIEHRDSLPGKNAQILEFAAANGQTLAPSYQEAVCTEFIIKVIEEFYPLSKTEKRSIRIITNEDIGQLIAQNNPVIKGVQTALVQSGKGRAIDQAEDIKPGDFVQFWNWYQHSGYGHCGVVCDINPQKTITLYSSHPITNGFGKHTFAWPDYIYAVRLQ